MFIQLFKPAAKSELILASIGALFILTGFVTQSLFGENTLVIRILFGLAFITGGYHKAVEGTIKTFEEKALNVEILMILAALGAFFTGNYAEGAILILIFSVSGVLESYTTQKSKNALTALLNLAPEEATLIDGSSTHIVSVASLRVGDIVSVKVGEKIPVDGTIIKGRSTLNEASITGESMPVEKGEDDFVYASSINETSLIHVRCDKDPKESTVQKIIDFVKNAQDDEPAVQSRINKIEKVYVYVVILLALAYMIIPPLFGWWSSEVAFQRGLIVLVVGSPCALVASITPGYLASISHASRKKVLIKGGSILEEIKDIQCVIFDKTGTLTKGKPTVQTHYIDPDKNALFPLFLGMEKASNHPLAKAIFEAFKDEDMIDCAPLEIPGKGLELEFNGHLYQVGKFNHVLPSNIKKTIDPLIKEGASMVVLFEDQVCVGYFSLIDEVKTEAKALITYLKSHNIYTVMVSGDLIETAQHISEKIEIDAFHGECLPGDKVDWVKHYQKKYQKVMMIGDGINDAPALTLADIAIAMGSGTDVSLESSDIVMMDSQLKGIELTFDLSNRLKKITTMNVLFSISVIGVMLLFNTFGWVLLPVGVVIHEVSTIIVILNSLRLLA